jgi:hypothetical protein
MYVRVDLKDAYIYLLNNVEAFDQTFKKREMRARELLGRPRWWYQRIKRLPTLPPNKKVNIWYSKRGRG